MKRLLDNGRYMIVMRERKGSASSILRLLKFAPLALMFACTSIVAGDESGFRKFCFDIPSKTADVSLIEFADTVNATLMLPFEEVRNIETPQLKGRFSLEEGIQRLLGKTDLVAEINGIQLTISRKKNVRGDNRVKITGSNKLVLAAASVALSSSISAQDVLEEIVVTGQTGSRIQTNLTSAQPISALTAEDFIASGALTAADALNQLPQLGDSLEGGVKY